MFLIGSIYEMSTRVLRFQLKGHDQISVGGSSLLPSGRQRRPLQSKRKCRQVYAVNVPFACLFLAQGSTFVPACAVKSEARYLVFPGPHKARPGSAPV